MLVTRPLHVLEPARLCTFVMYRRPMPFIMCSSMFFDCVFFFPPTTGLAYTRDRS